MDISMKILRASQGIIELTNCRNIDLLEDTADVIEIRLNEDKPSFGKFIISKGGFVVKIFQNLASVNKWLSKQEGFETIVDEDVREFEL